MAEADNFKDFIEKYMERIHSKICEYIPNEDPIFMDKIMKCYVNRKGHYRRPSYTLLWTSLYGGNVNNAILPGAIQQVSEDWILMHDDIIDDNELRRGGPSAHVMFGTEYAILGGDALQTVMWKMINDATNSMEKNGKAYFDKIYDIMFRTNYGQYLDVKLTKEYDIDNFTIEDYYKSIHTKSAYYSVYGPMQCGAVIAGISDKKTMDKIAEYGTYAGYAFQIKDDILDCTSTEEKLGKTIGNDIMEGNKTLILYHTVHNSSQSQLYKLKGIYSKKKSEKSDEDLKFVLNTFKELKSIEFAEKEAINFTNKAITTFDKLEKDIAESELKELARQSIGDVAKRNE